MDTGRGRWDTGDATSWVPYVQPEWRPYANGDWVQDSEFGWTWTGHDLWWGWLTHHHGQWRTDRFGRWAWVPGREWSPGRASANAVNVAVPHTPDRVAGPTGVTRATGAIGRREAVEAGVRLRHARINEEQAQYRWEQRIAIERERQLEDAEERARQAREARYYVIEDSDDSTTQSYDTSSSAPARHGSSDSSSGGSSSGSGGSRTSTSSSGSSGAVPRDTSGSSKAPPRHGSRP